MTGAVAFASRKKRTRRATTPEVGDANDAESRPSLANVGPVWITAIAGLVTAVAGAIALFGLGQSAPGPVVEIAEAGSTETTVSAVGTYAGLDGDAQTVVVLVRPAGTDDPWAAVEADRVPADGGPGDAEAGQWTVGIPLEGGPYEVLAVVVPARRGGGFETTTLDELRDAGPEAEIVRARSDPVTVEGT